MTVVDMNIKLLLFSILTKFLYYKMLIRSLLYKLSDNTRYLQGSKVKVNHSVKKYVDILYTFTLLHLVHKMTRS